MNVLSGLKALFSSLMGRRREVPPASPQDRAFDSQTLLIDYARQRRECRYPAGMSTQLSISDAEPIRCVLADASRDGVRLILPRPLSVHERAHLSLFFNGYVLSRRVSVVWSREFGGRIEAGARFLGEQRESRLMDVFLRYLRWKSALRKAA